MKIFQYKTRNVGDTLTQPILEHFLKVKTEVVEKNETSKFIGVGSVFHAIRKGDVVWGTGSISNIPFNLPECKILAVRGKLTEKLFNLNVGVYGDPAILLPLIYNPQVEKKHKVGIVEHYVDRGLYPGEGYRIEVESNWKQFVKEIKSCEKIISSSLHGCIIAEAYGIPAKWVKLSNKVIGNGFKFYDWLSASDRKSFDEPLTEQKLKELQNGLLGALKCYCKK